MLAKLRTTEPNDPLWKMVYWSASSAPLMGDIGCIRAGRAPSYR